MTDEAAQGFALHVEAAIEVVRDALIRIEEQAQQDDDSKWIDASRRFAMLIAPLRDYLNGLSLGRDLPQALGRRLEPLLADLDPISDVVAAGGLQEHIDALRGLVQRAQARS